MNIYSIYILYIYIYITRTHTHTHIDIHIYLSIYLVSDDDKFTLTKHLTPPIHHSSRPAAAYTGMETPVQ